MDGLGYTLLVSAAFVLGVALGAITVGTGWTTDCDRLQAHLAGNVVYKCFKQEPANGR